MIRLFLLTLTMMSLRDEMEEWSASEANLFEEALDKYGKDFNDIRQDFLPWKTLKSIVEYYYMWKTTDRYVQQKRLKAAEAESKLKQVIVGVLVFPWVPWVVLLISSFISVTLPVISTGNKTRPYTLANSCENA